MNTSGVNNGKFKDYTKEEGNSALRRNKKEEKKTEILKKLFFCKFGHSFIRF